MKRPAIFTWHIHGSYLYYLSQCDCDFYIPKGTGDGYGGRTSSFPWSDNVIEVPANEVKNQTFDCVLFQSRKNYDIDQYTVLSEKQRRLPKMYLEHDPPREHPTDTKHPVDDPDILLVHVTHFNNLMWDNNRTPTTVIDHGVIVPDNVAYTGEREQGIVVVNNLARRGRRLGLDIFEQARTRIPLDIVGLGSQEVNGLGPMPLQNLSQLITQYRFFFNPIRYTSLGLAVCEAMMCGLPIIGLATTEMATTIQNGVTGYVSNDLDELVDRMSQLLHDKPLAEQLSYQAKQYAQQQFNIQRFIIDWQRAIDSVL